MTRRQLYLLIIGFLIVAVGLGVAGREFLGHTTEVAAGAPRVATGDDRPFAGGAERSAFVSNAVSSCTNEMVGKEPLGRHLSDGEIETYCVCYSNGMADLVTADDVRQMTAGGEPMAIVRDKAARILQSCGELLPSK